MMLTIPFLYNIFIGNIRGLIMICQKCYGTKKMLGSGMMVKECDACDKPIPHAANDNSDVPDTIFSTEVKRGRPKKSESK
jgi:uncharacterized protein (DUF983 family)